MYESTAPDYPAPILAWRTWALSRRPDGLRLRSVAKATVWEPAVPLTARCLRTRLATGLRRHEAPFFDCICGIYGAGLATAASYLGDLRLRGELRSVTQVIGRVALWGDVIECERGYRGAAAYPQDLYVAARTSDGELRQDAQAVAAALQAYAVPVTIVDLDERQLLRTLAESGTAYAA